MTLKDEAIKEMASGIHTSRASETRDAAFQAEEALGALIDWLRDKPNFALSDTVQDLCDSLGGEG